MKTTYFLDMRSEAADGMGSIRLRIVHNRTSTTMRTGIRLFPYQWDGEKAVNHYEAEAINVRLQAFKMETDKAIILLSFRDDYESLTAPEIKALIEKPKVAKTRHSIVALFNEYMETTGISEGTKTIYKATLEKILLYSGDVDISAINLKWLYGFENFLSRTQRTNGRAMYLRCLRAVCNYAVNTEVTENYPFANFSIKQEATRKRSVSVEKLREFIAYPVDKRTAMFRDYFLLMFYFIGVNAKDLLLAEHSAVEKGRFKYVRKKTGKMYSIKIEPEAEALLKRYSGKKYLLEAMDHCQGYKNFLHMMNDAIGNIGEVRWTMVQDENNLFAPPKLEKEIVPIIPDITSYYARHCWATFAYEIGIPLDVISQAMGHSVGNRTTLIYVKYDQTRVDEANRKVIDYLTKPFER